MFFIISQLFLARFRSLGELNDAALNRAKLEYDDYTTTTTTTFFEHVYAFTFKYLSVFFPVFVSLSAVL
jgi:hypothetical protein